MGYGILNWVTRDLFPGHFSSEQDAWAAIARWPKALLKDADMYIVVDLDTVDKEENHGNKR
ncbi:hypothetical protein [Schleiferilactobacillus harbinensis]|jgi:hypothetical protein|uniref:hypothetical protein n=1 Tax=Schleiferilactobacillus harbinensis TaxID=304207 RepID=UPI00116E4BD7|nr:hypothetical protein [Schleiferilactobacillus harbinensis]GEK07426.1 hypothetical protein LHA01_26650 [Schleiferilactobacillus harbinensis]